ncbi:hypothetical protein D3C87_1453880 [compost metagenome]
MLETLEAGARQDFQALSQRHLILDEGRVGLEVFLVVGWRAGQGWTRLAIDRVEDINRVGTDRATGTLDDRLVVVIFVFDTGQQGVIKTTDGEMPREVQLSVLVRPLKLPVVKVAAQRVSVGGDPVGLYGITFKGAIEPLETTTQGPVIAQQMLET